MPQVVACDDRRAKQTPHSSSLAMTRAGALRLARYRRGRASLVATDRARTRRVRARRLDRFPGAHARVVRSGLRHRRDRTLSCPAATRTHAPAVAARPRAGAWHLRLRDARL